MSRNGNKKTPIRLLLTGGGTGGHLFPAVATAEKVQARVAGGTVLFIGTRRRQDSEHLRRDGFPVQTIHSFGLKGKRIPALLQALAILPFSLCEAWYRIMRFRPHVVLGVGGYVTGPVILAAWMLRRPTVIHEQNSVPGLANRTLGRFVDKICISLPQSASFFPAAKTVLTGNPVRGRILETASAPKRKTHRLTLLVLGGSQGAHGVNELMVETLCLKDPAFAGIEVIHQTGVDDESRVVEAYREAGIEVEVAPFFTDMASVYARADLVVSRSGATTLAELAVLGKPALLIPYPHAADNHQEKNAAWYVAGGGAVMLKQEALDARRLAAEIKTIIGDQTLRENMATAMSRLARPDAADRIVDICLALT